MPSFLGPESVRSENATTGGSEHEATAGEQGMAGVVRAKALELLQRFLLQVLAPNPAVPRRVRVALLRLAGVRIGAKSHFGHSSIFVNNRIEFGHDCFVNTQCRLDPGTARLEIGDDVLIGPGATITAASHRLGTSRRRAMEAEDATIRIGSGSWIGAAAVVLPGVTIGPGCVIGAGAVVTKDCEPNQLYVGVPAWPVRALSER